jgi:hypothetical protein
MAGVLAVVGAVLFGGPSARAAFIENFDSGLNNWEAPLVNNGGGTAYPAATYHATGGSVAISNSAGSQVVAVVEHTTQSPDGTGGQDGVRVGSGESQVEGEAGDAVEDWNAKTRNVQDSQEPNQKQIRLLDDWRFDFSVPPRFVPFIVDFRQVF